MVALPFITKDHHAVGAFLFDEIFTAIETTSLLYVTFLFNADLQKSTRRSY